MIEYIFIALVVFSILHFLYENCVLPEIRQALVYRLFAIRDDLRKQKIASQINDSTEYRFAEEALNNAIVGIPYADLALTCEITHHLRSNTALAKVVRHRSSVLDGSRDVAIQTARRKMRKVFSYSLIAGMGSWLMYLLPALLGILAYQRVKQFVKACLGIPANQFSPVTQNYRLCSSSPVCV